MHLPTIFSVASTAAIVAASPLTEHTLSPSACHKVDLIVDLLKLYKAMPFCSSFLSIPTHTTTIVSVTSTIETTRTITTTSVPISYSTSTVTITTSTPTVTSTETTIVATISSVVTTTSSSTATEYTNGAAQRREAHLQPAAEIVGHSITIPEYLKALEKEAISSACSCLSIPIKTASVTSTLTTVIDTVGLTTITLTTVSVITTTTTITSAVPTFTILPATSVYSSTFTIYTPLATETVSPCQNIVIYNNEDQGRFTDFQLANQSDSWEDCCTQCFFDYTNCYSYGYSEDDGGCSVYVTTDKFGPTSPQCPSGIGSDPLGTARFPGPNGFTALGPCFGTNGA